MSRASVACLLLSCLTAGAGSVTAQPFHFGDVPGYEWFRSYRSQDDGYYCGFFDVYALDNENYAMSGYVRMNGQNDRGWLLVIDENGQALVDKTYEYNNGGAARYVRLYTLIQTDDGGFLLGGRTQIGATSFGNFDMIKTNDEGEVEWWTVCEQGSVAACHAVIELKGGTYLGCGMGDNYSSYAVMVSNAGEVIWERYYNGYTLSAVREIEDGLAFSHQTPQVNQSIELLITDFNGEPRQRSGTGNGWPTSLIRTRDGGFAMGGGASHYAGFKMVKFDRDGNVQWTRTQNFGMRLDQPERANCIAELDDGYILVGENTEERTDDGMMRVDLQGNVLWWTCADSLPLPRGRGDGYFSAITKPDGSIIICGKSYWFDEERRLNQGNMSNGIIFKLAAQRFAPLIIDRFPEPYELEVLPGDTVHFRVRAVDIQNDDLSYVWTVEGEEASRDSSADIIFSELGDYHVVCVVSDGQGMDSTFWDVHAVGLYIASWNPDSLRLTLSRGGGIDFSIELRAVPGIDVECAWLLTDMATQERSEIGGGPMVFWDFPRTGNYALEAMAFRDELSDRIRWNIAVRGLILDFQPEDLRFTTEQNRWIEFGIVAAAVDTVEFHYRWTLDGQEAGEDSTLNLFFPDAGRHLVQARLDDGVEQDSLIWDVTVLQVESVISQSAPGEFSLGLTPNPLNAAARITLTLPGGGPASVFLVDVNGRTVWKNDLGRIPAGRYSLTLDGSGVPAGVYVLQLRAGDLSALKKAVIIK